MIELSAPTESALILPALPSVASTKPRKLCSRGPINTTFSEALEYALWFLDLD